jgi:hypothetical protein
VNRPFNVHPAFLMRALPSLGPVELFIPEKGGILLALYDGRGRLIKHLVDGYMAAGNYRVELGDRAGRNKALPQGLYFLALYRTGNGNKELLASCPAAILGR